MLSADGSCHQGDNQLTAGLRITLCNQLYTKVKLWIADASAGLVSTSDYSKFSNYTIPGPYTNNVADIHFAGKTSLITGGTVDNAWGNVYRPFQVVYKLQEIPGTALSCTSQLTGMQ